MSNPVPQTLENPYGQSQAASSAGQEQAPAVAPQFDIGAFNEAGIDPSKVIAQHKQEQGKAHQVAQPQESAPQLPGKEEKANPKQPTQKDERHFAQFVTKAEQTKYDLAKLAVESDERAIYKIAETDKDLAQRLLKEFDYGTDNIEELIQKETISKSAKPEEVQKEIADQKWKQQMSEELLNEKILRLKGENSDLIGEVEDKFREVYADPAFAKYDEAKKLAIARTLVGKENPQTSVDDVALAVLKNEEGVVTTARGSTKLEKTRVTSPEFKKMQSSMGIADKDLEILPENIEDLVSQMYGPLVGR